MEFKLCKFDGEISKDRTFEGYASTFGNIDTDGDVIEPGAYSKSIQERFPANKIKVLWQHNEPIGKPLEMREDSRGLHVVAKISETPRGDEAITLARDGVIDTMSVGFVIPAGKSDIDDRGVRHIREAKLFEFSLVTFPANEQAVITGVKAMRDAARIADQLSVKEQAELLNEVKNLHALLTGQPANATATTQPRELKELQQIIDQLQMLKTNY